MMAGVSASRLCELLGERDSLARAIPLPAVARRASVTPVLPPTTESRALFDALGGALLVENVEAFDALSAATATIAAHFRYLNAVARWAGAHGVPSDQAERYVASVFAGVAETLAKPSASLSDLAEAHATPRRDQRTVPRAT
jgi:pyrroline-5-carboxylate reductase